MDFNRVDKGLKISIEKVLDSLEIDEHVFLNNPEIIQQEKIDFFKNNPIKIPDSLHVKDLWIPSSYDDYKIRLHIYQPDNFDKNRVIIYFHGGGYVFGLPEQVENQMIEISQDMKATIISVDYRLVPEYPFPIPILDGFDALQWTIEHGEKELGINTSDIAAFGASAGGHLAAAVTQMTYDHNIKNIRHQFLLYPVIHNKLNTPSMQEFTDSPLWNKKLADIAWLHFLGRERKGESIIYADLTNYANFSKLPKTTIVACELDPLRDENIEFSQLLYQAGVKTELWVIPGALHVFDLFNCSMTDEYKEFFRKRIFQYDV
ncbi:alpha/beta hydrolase [Chryseobacterium daecheongense]|uniref:alpha/beta hydrolase n=1 Tax=Chryseobacterium daecheongense TaxID=192389 RepID=UPI001FD64305|nr:alpha/beta hydrolase [Chryseobacterium daecheongense]UOU96859.1 alpha/beta hydrolase [Chryseobacterium daecheongense]